MKRRRSKFGNIKVTDDGFTFDSKAEHKRYCQLKLMQTMGQICDLKVHPRYPIAVNGTRVCVYVGDFSYLDATGSHIEDVKGVKTSVFRLKAKLMKAANGLDIECVSLDRMRRAGL